MFCSQRSPSPSWLVLLALIFTSFLTFNHVSALDIAYCSTLNTASTNKNSSIYQSNGLCRGFCVDKYAFAIVQDDGCWCSDYVPASTADGCSKKCPGYPPDLCGGNGVFGYISLTKPPAGTKGSSGTTESDKSSTSTTSTRAPTTSSTWTPTPVVSLETVTGEVRTVTVTPTVPPNSESQNSVSKDTKNKLGTGGAVGLAIGLVALVALVSFLVWFCLRKRRQDKAEAYNDVSGRGSAAGLGVTDSLGGTGPSRTMSENSRYVLGTDGRQVVETWERDQSQPGARNSRLMPVDPRLDPFAPVYQRGGLNKSRESVNTIQDNHDYSRRVAPNGPILRALNPDDD
ncbi:uncharacterized protein BP5553_06840 [Venustampulla echinocandica]|uniref:WSC domain-containing protein n=1 Tax=Venustampulla echinocandica TaxID=2656787 RepID=A0A370TL24_9HELO|nr:uncharacterized protein BP5553_06840 [Venustampulla echinocandica]RDL36228.1 hypothetical protein BP5553_06840 [Venustampulla echinocandica]